MIAKTDIDVTIHGETGKEPEAPDFSRPFADLKADALERFEKRYLEALLVHTRGNLSKAARVARHERKSLWRLLRKYGIDAASFRQRLEP